MKEMFSAPITELLRQAREGDPHAEADLWSECFRALLPVARRSLNRWRSSYEAEDLVLTCLGRVSVKIRAGAYPSIDDRGALWALLLKGLKRKAMARCRYDERKCRRGGAFAAGWEANDLLGREAEPDAEEEFRDMVANAMAILPTDGHRELARMILIEGLGADEVVMRLDCSPATVYRRLQRIRELWKNHFDETTTLEQI